MIMTEKEQSAAAKAFAEKWAGRGYEKGESQAFWLMLLQNVFGVENPDDFIEFEEQVHLDHTSFIDAHIPTTRVLIEQKSIDHDLDEKIKQSDGSYLTPFQQAKRYISGLPVSEHPLWVVSCNFKEFYVYDMEKPDGEPEKINLSDLAKEYYRLQFLVDTGKTHIAREMEISIKAGEIVGLLYDAFLKQYKNPKDPDALKSLNKLCVRLVFCLYAEHAGIFGKHLMFHDYLVQFNTQYMHYALRLLFRVLDQKEEDRDIYMPDDLAAFPYVDGGLFADGDIVIPPFTDEIRDLLLNKASEGFDWSQISPTIFGAVFESTLNPLTRRSGGMHYTSIENIHKVIDPLFLNDLKAEFEKIATIKTIRTQTQRLKEFQSKLASMVFLDPAAGSGNFLTETYLSLRRLENKALEIMTRRQIMMGFDNVSPIQVSISQFNGIEVNDFAVTVARTALWIAENQMMKETENIVLMDLDFLPLKTSANIVEGNALRMDWNDVVDKGKLNYIMGNPPFVGYSLQSASQKSDILSLYVDENNKPYNTAGKIDYVAGWYWKASEMMQETAIRTALVSTNSITQGEQVASIWKPLYDRFGIHIDFAHQTFIWDSEASAKAHVHCVIVGFSVARNEKKKTLYSGGIENLVENINPYLVEGPNVFIDSRKTPLCDVPEMVYGNKPADGGFLFLEPEERQEVINREPGIAQYIRRIYGATEFINNRERYCLWLVGVSPTVIRQSSFISDRIEKVRQFRLKSAKEPTRKSADTPFLFQEIRYPNEEYIVVPGHSSENRRYIPFGFMKRDIIVSNAVHIIPKATLYHYGVLESYVHMAWVRAVCGRIKSDYRYSKDIVYNNFPWPSPTEKQKQRIERTAQEILDARALYPDASLADLYDDAAMPIELRTAHQKNDRAVMEAYGFPAKGFSESECVAELMKMYQKLTEEKETGGSHQL